MPTTPNDLATTILNRLNHQHLTDAAEWAATQLDRFGSARIDLEPGDATVYRIGIFAARSALWRDGETVAARDALVVVDGFGSFLWTGDHELHWSYVASKLSVDGMHTGVVIAAFLNLVVGVTA